MYLKCGPLLHAEVCPDPSSQSQPQALLHGQGLYKGVGSLLPFPPLCMRKWASKKAVVPEYSHKSPYHALDLKLQSNQITSSYVAAQKMKNGNAP